MRGPLKTEVLVDFIDDALLADHVLSVPDIDGIMKTLAEAGVKRVAWAYYADGRGGLLMPDNLRDGKADYGQGRQSYARLGNPLRQAVISGHRHGLEVYAYYKPYETGVSMVMPEGSPEAAAFGLLPHGGGRLGVLDPFVRAHPGLRLMRRPEPPPPAGPIGALRLVKRDAGPTRITANHLQIWTSAANYRYERAPISFGVTETVEPAARDVTDHAGARVTRKGEPMRVLSLYGFRIDAPYVLVTTDFTEGPADFTNSGAAMLSALDADGRPLPGLTATGTGVWLASRADFRNWGLIFDYGWGRAVTALDAPNTNGRSGIIAFARGKNETLPAALCETEPAVQDFWLACLREIVATGVDGVDFREENHCTHTDEPEAYGFNPVILARANDAADVARVRGDAYTAFLRKAKALLSAGGVTMRYQLNMDWFRPDPPASRALAYPANIDFQWRQWIAEGLLDEAALRAYHHRAAMRTDPVGRDMVEACRTAGLPVAFNHHVFDDKPCYREEAERVAADSRFASLILYELSNFLRTGADGKARFTLASAADILKA